MRQLATVHLKVAHRRADFLHKLTTRLARTKRAIAVESLNVAGMVRNRRLARTVSDAGFAEFVRQLAYKDGLVRGEGVGRGPLVPVVEDVQRLRSGQRRSDAVGSGVDMSMRHGP